MVLNEFIQKLRERGIEQTEAQWRFAVKERYLPKPRLDASHRFDFTDEDVDRAVKYFSSKSKRRQLANA